MTQQQFYTQLRAIQNLYYTQESELNALESGVNSQDGVHREKLDTLLTYLDIESTPETRYAAYARIVHKKFEPLDQYAQSQNFSVSERDTLFTNSYEWVAEYYHTLQSSLLEHIFEHSSLGDFYDTLLRYTHSIGKYYSAFFPLWYQNIVSTNRALAAQFHNDTQKVMSYLQENSLYELDESGNAQPFCYSLLLATNQGHEMVSYKQFAPDIAYNIISLYSELIEALGALEDDIFLQKQEWIDYFTALKNAWNEDDTTKIFDAWQQVDTTWMAVQTPLQIVHPIEYYEDIYRKAVSPDYDVRIIDDTLFTSTVQKNISSMYEHMYDEIGRENFPESYEHSRKALDQTQLYIGSPVLQYGSVLNGAYSAQVIPNNDSVSEHTGVKIFAFPKSVLQSQQAAPKMRIDSEFFDADFLATYESFLTHDTEYYRVYDIETIGHEYGHTLWTSLTNEAAMNSDGQYKNIEEWKATAGGLVSQFMSRDTSFDATMMIPHIMRSVKMIRNQQVTEVLPYYCECLIHLHILFHAGILSYDADTKKISVNSSEQTLSLMKELYTAIYTQQIFTYLSQLPAGSFLFEFVEIIDGIYLPKDETVKKFVQAYYARYKEIGNQTQ